MDGVLTAVAALSGAVSVVLLLLVLARISGDRTGSSGILRVLRDELLRAQRESAEHTGNVIKAVFERQDKRMEALTLSVSDSLRGVDKRFADFSRLSEQKIENMRVTMDTQLKALRDDNTRQIEKMRETVDEKLQKTLEDRIGQSFKLVSERLEQVYKGLGEMQKLATDVGDLQRVLSNVKTRGTLGEVQLGAILEQIMSPEQYEANAATNPMSDARVEFAIKMPGDDGSAVYLPIDAKFPLDVYSELLDAYDTSDKEAVAAARKRLEEKIKFEAKKIRDKYIYPPATTEFAVMFLPIEGLYAEVVQRGLVEILQRDYKISIAGPTTMAALLNSLQMGFRTLAIQRRSGEVWKVLGTVKTEFDKFGGVLEKARKHITQANNDLDVLISTRTNRIQRQLRNVATIAEHTPEENAMLEE
jgi:DNA recombination protein RmuC